MTTPFTIQGPAATGMSTSQQGYAPVFPAPLGIEQYLGQPYGGFPQQHGGLGQQHWGLQQQAVIQQIVQSVVSQLLPVAHQVILPQVLATAMQQIPLHLQQLVAQQAAQFGQQAAQFGQQAAQFGQQVPFGRPYAWGI